MSMQFETLLCYGFYYLVQWKKKLKDTTKLKAASHSEMPNFGSDVDGFTVNKTNQEICNSHNKNETNMIITFTIKHDKFYELLFFTPNMMFIRLLVETMCRILWPN